MYLATLNDEEKQYFLEMAYNMARLDGDYSAKEKKAIEAYCREMQISLGKQEIKKSSIEETINKISNLSEMRVKKIIVFEIIGLALADNIYHETEREMVEKMAASFSVEEGYTKKCEEVVKEYIEFQRKINQIVLNSLEV